MVEENGLHRTDVVPATRSTALRTRTAGRCMEWYSYCRPVRDAGVTAQIPQIPQDRIRDTRRFGKSKNDHIH
jgi:hypothetical protein